MTPETKYSINNLAKGLALIDDAAKHLDESQFLAILVDLRDNENCSTARNLLLVHQHKLAIIDEAQRITKG